MTFNELLESTLIVIGYFATRDQALRVATCADHATRGARVIELCDAPGDRFAVVR